MLWLSGDGVRRAVVIYVFVMSKQRALVNKRANPRVRSGLGYVGEGKIDIEVNSVFFVIEATVTRRMWRRTI